MALVALAALDESSAGGVNPMICPYPLTFLSIYSQFLCINIQTVRFSFFNVEHTILSWLRRGRAIDIEEFEKQNLSRMEHKGRIEAAGGRRNRYASRTTNEKLTKINLGSRARLPIQRAHGGGGQ